MNFDFSNLTVNDDSSNSTSSTTPGLDNLLSMLTSELKLKPVGSLCDADDKLFEDVARAVVECKVRRLNETGTDKTESQDTIHKQQEETEQQTQNPTSTSTSSPSEFKFTTPSKPSTPPAPPPSFNFDVDKFSANFTDKLFNIGANVGADDPRLGKKKKKGKKGRESLVEGAGEVEGLEEGVGANLEKRHSVSQSFQPPSIEGGSEKGAFDVAELSFNLGVGEEGKKKGKRGSRGVPPSNPPPTSAPPMAAPPPVGAGLAGRFAYAVKGKEEGKPPECESDEEMEGDDPMAISRGGGGEIETGSLRRTAGALYTAGDYPSAVGKYTECIDMHMKGKGEKGGDNGRGMDETLGVLHGNRAASYMMFEMYPEAGRDCETAMRYLDSSSSLVGKLRIRAGRAWSKAGEFNKAKGWFGTTFGEELKEDGIGGIKGVEGWEREVREGDQQVACQQLHEGLAKFEKVNKSCSGWKSGWDRVVDTLTKLNMWKRARDVCEKFAIKEERKEFTSEFYDAKSGTWVRRTLEKAKVLNGDSGRLNQTKGREWTKEVAMRLSVTMGKSYVKAHRMDERYHECSAAMEGLEIATTWGNIWCQGERAVLRKLVGCKDSGDSLFRKGDYLAAVSSYSAGIGLFGLNEKGKVLAVLYCNRAAGQMALKKYREGAKDCTSALDIDAGYMKARLRRARCRARTKNYFESKADYNEWLKMAEVGDGGGGAGLRGEKQALREEIESVKRELKECLAAEGDEKKERDRARWFEKNFATNNSSRRAPPTGGAKENYYGSRRSSTAASGEPPPPRGHSAYGRRHSDYGSSKTHRGPHPGGPGSSSSSSRPSSRSAGAASSPGSDENISHYKVLNVDKAADTNQIKKAYHKAALKYHPDKNKEEGAADQFRRVQMAWEILQDPSTKRRYDAEQNVKARYSRSSSFSSRGG
ncbi:hypothetical protein TL16_g08803, partial [Triparma laevis f. inornata]